jgi:hypothetical protein
MAQMTGLPSRPRSRWPGGVTVKVWHRYFGSAYGDEERQALAEVLAQEYQTNGPQVQAFEKEFSAFCETRHAFATSSCTAGLMLAAQLCGLHPGDEVVTTPLTFASTGQAILSCGATPVFADVDPRTFNIDAERVADRVTPRTKALFVVHLYATWTASPPWRMGGACRSSPTRPTWSGRPTKAGRPGCSPMRRRSAFTPART